MKQSYKILMLSSSTGGHAIPILELYKEITREGSVSGKIIHSGSEIELELFRGYPAIMCKSGKLNRHQMGRNIREALYFVSAFLKSLLIIAGYRPQVIFSKGGFNGAPFLFWAKVFGIPYFLHESDSEMGAANNYFYLGSVKTFVSFPLELYSQKKQKLSYSGFITRDFPEKMLPENQPAIFITGGSQGSSAINDKILDILPQLLAKYKVIHHIGINDLDKVSNAIKTLPKEFLQNYEYFEFSLEKFNQSIAGADLIISRAGSTIGEIAKMSKASILIPYPYAASDHQTKNARFLEKHGAAIVIKQDQLTADNLKERIEFMLKDSRNKDVVGENIHRVLKTDGKKIISEELLKYMRNI